MDGATIEPGEEPLGTADRGIERHVLAGGVAVEGDVQVVDPGARHGDSLMIGWTAEHSADLAPLVGMRRFCPLPRRAQAADLRRFRRVQRRPGPGLEGGARPAGHPDRAGDHLLPLPAGHLQVEQGRAPAVRADHPQLARPTANQPPGRRRADLRHHHDYRADRSRRAGYQRIPHGSALHQQTGRRPAHRQARFPPGLELHRPARTSRDTHTVTEVDDTPAKHQLFLRGCLPDAITIPVTCFLRDSGAVTPYHPRNNKLSRGPAVACRRSTHGFGSDAAQYVLRALRAGAAWFLVKPTPPKDLIGLVQAAAEGHTVLSPAAARLLIVACADRQPARDRAGTWPGRSPTARPRCWPASVRACPARRSRPGCTCPKPGSRATSRGCWTGWA